MDDNINTVDHLILLSSITQQLTDAVITTDTDFKITYANPAFRELYGYSKDEILGLSPEVFNSSSDSDRILKEIYQTISAGGTWKGEAENRKKDGTVLLCDITVFPIKGQDGKTSAYVGICRDITKRKQVEKQLRESEERFRLIYEKSPLGYQSLDENGNFIKVNPAWVSLMGYEENEVLGKSFTEFMAEGYPELFAQRFPYFKSVGKVKAVPFEMVTRDGVNIHVEIDGVISHYPDGSFKQTHCILHDVTEQKRIHREMEYLLKKYDMKNRELESIFSVVSHDMRSPLVNTNGFSGELKKSCEELGALLENEPISESAKKELDRILNQDIPESLKFITAGASKACELLDGLLRISRLGLEKFNPEEIDMNKLIDKILPNLKYRLTRENICLEVDSLPKCIGDRNQIDHVFNNLIDNAIKYLHPSRRGMIRISGSVEDSCCIYFVQDNGVGIPKNQMSKVFEIFHRIDPKGPVKGEGLGLSIVSRIVERSNGRLWVESELGKGSCFYVSLPAAVQ